LKNAGQGKLNKKFTRVQDGEVKNVLNFQFKMSSEKSATYLSKSTNQPTDAMVK